jgi:UDP-GlcNAc:undecaprenyl-phosphate/decaprenyl-phosphate GlcNAc-1-phosphate transferase
MRFELLIGFGLALTVASLLTLPASWVAERCGFLDDPIAWKTHARPTPYLGGVAVLAGVTAGSVAAPNLDTVALLLGGSWLFSVVGVVDDAMNLDVRLRLIFELIGGAFLWSLNLGWQFSGSQWINLFVTVAWVVVCVNAFNVIDLMDGLATSVLIASAAGLALLACVENEMTTSVIALAAVGACIGFLPFNAAKPARIFLGDGGTMALGFLVAALIPIALQGGKDHPHAITAGLLLFWVPFVDATYRALKRMRRRVSLMTAGHDSLADGLQRRLGTPLNVSLVMAGAQAVCSGLAVGVIELRRDGDLAAISLMVTSLLVIYAASSDYYNEPVDPIVIRK